MLYRQGDVLIRKVEGLSLPATAKPLLRDAAGRLILAAGEVTGHHHAVAERTATLLPWVLADGSPAMALCAPNGATVVHEEHDPIVLPAGDFVVSIKREYVPRALPRRVID